MEDAGYMNEKQLANYINCSVSTLRNHRHAGTGIPYFKIGRSVRYKKKDVEDYMERRRIERNPSLD